MAEEYLPGDIRDRILDLMSEQGISQGELAQMIGISSSALSRFLNGETDKLSHDKIPGIARVFKVSADFLLGLTETPRESEHGIQDLGLSQQALRNLKNGKVNARVLSYLLENESFGEVTQHIGRATDWRIPPAKLFGTRNMEDSIGHIRGIEGRCRFDPSRIMKLQNLFMKAVSEVWTGLEFSYQLDEMKEMTEKGYEIADGGKKYGFM